MPRISAPYMLRSTLETVSASAICPFRGSIPHPTQQLCTLRGRRYRRLTQHSPPGGSLHLTWAGLSPADRASFAWRLPQAGLRSCAGSRLHCRGAERPGYEGKQSAERRGDLRQAPRGGALDHPSTLASAPPPCALPGRCASRRSTAVLFCLSSPRLRASGPNWPESFSEHLAHGSFHCPWSGIPRPRKSGW